MSDQPWSRVRELFERALDEAPADLAAWLDREGAVDPTLREEVASLLASHAQAGSFLSSPAADRLSDLMADDAAEPGQVVGPYTIVRELGRGGMGHVYLATDARLGRRVALKALRPAMTADPAHRDRLRREARAAGSLTHPGICTVYALEEFDGQLYIATEFVEGQTLREAMRDGTRPPADEVTRTVVDLADALASAHARGITHRDLKPENVMRTREGRLKILDFGLASLDATGVEAGPSPLAAGGATGSPRLTQPGTLLGTPAYMAPEQLNGQAVDARADVFALGVLTYEYACGSHPFSAATPLAVAARILESEAVSIDRWRPDLPSALVAIIDRCLRKRPADRFATAAALASALARAGTAPAGNRLARWWRTHQLAAIGLYLVACGLAWQIKEWQPGLAAWAFVLTCITATVGGILRGHLLFTERVTGAGLATERRRASPVTLVSDLLIGLLLAVNGVLLTGTRPVMGALTIALGVGIALARVVVEPATTAATFER